MIQHRLPKVDRTKLMEVKHLNARPLETKKKAIMFDGHGKEAALTSGEIRDRVPLSIAVLANVRSGLFYGQPPAMSRSPQTDKLGKIQPSGRYRDVSFVFRRVMRLCE